MPNLRRARFEPSVLGDAQLRRRSQQLSPKNNGAGLAAGAIAPHNSRVVAPDCPYVSRGGLKLAAALRAFQIDVAGLTCADFGSHAGGFVDCLLQHGAAQVWAIEPGYGVLDYKLRRDPRVVVHERQNAMHFATDQRFDLISIDVGWTPQERILPNAARLLAADAIGVITLIKPHYEAPRDALERGVLREERRTEVLANCRRVIESSGWSIAGECASPIAGHGGNQEELWWLRRAKTGGDARNTQS